MCLLLIRGRLGCKGGRCHGGGVNKLFRVIKDSLMSRRSGILRFREWEFVRNERFFSLAVEVIRVEKITIKRLRKSKEELR